MPSPSDNTQNVGTCLIVFGTAPLLEQLEITLEIKIEITLEVLKLVTAQEAAVKQSSRVHRARGLCSELAGDRTGVVER